MEEDLSYELKIPVERVPILIGRGGSIKKEIEEGTHSTIQVSAEGDVFISGQDGLALYTAREIVKAVGRGFNPKIALQLLKTDYTLEVIDISDTAGKNKSALERIRGRVIGKEGQARAEIEHLTGTSLSVYGKTIGIIGESDAVYLAREALAMLLQGSMHKTIYSWLERQKRERRWG